VHTVSGDAGLLTSAITSGVDAPNRTIASGPVAGMDAEQATLAAA